MFSGENPREWVRKCNKYFLINRTTEEDKLLLVEMFLDGKVDNWFQGIKLERPNLNWPEFEKLLCQRFSDHFGRDIVEEFNKLQQTSTIEKYQEKFEELKTLMLIKNRSLTEEYFVSSFTSGLKDEVKPMVKMFKPTTLLGAFEVVHLQEQALKLQSRTIKEGSTAIAEPKFGLYRNSATTNGNGDYYKLPVGQSNKAVNGKGSETTKRISPQEIQFRKTKAYDLSVEKGMG